MKIPTKKEIEKYRRYLEREGKKFKLTQEDLSNLYDLFYMVDSPSELSIDFRKTLKMNKMNDWFDDFHLRIEKIVIPELYKNDKKQKKKEAKKNS